MPLYAGVCETNITPPPDVWMGGYAGRGRASGVQDELYARVLVLDNGQTRLALVTADLVAVQSEMAARIQENVAQVLNTAPEAVMLHCSHTHGGPYTYPFRNMGSFDAAYMELFQRKIAGAARQAAENLQPAHLTYGEASAQIGVNRRETNADGKVVIGRNYGGPVAPLVQVLCVNGADGRTFALLFSHACHPTTMGGDNRTLTADWPGAAVLHLKERFRRESAETGIAADALPFFLQGCCGDINPLRKGTWEDVHANGRKIADAAHTARWNAHGRLGEMLEYGTTTIDLPTVLPDSIPALTEQSEFQSGQMDRGRQSGQEAQHLHAMTMRDWAQDALKIASNPDYDYHQPFTIQKLNFGGVTLLGFPAEMFVQYQLDFQAQSTSPVFCLGYTNGCVGYLPTTSEYARGGYEIEEAYKYYGTLNFAPGCEPLLRQAVQTLMQTELNHPLR